MDLSLAGIWAEMGFLARAVAVVLIGMGVGTFAIGIERLLVLSKGMSSSDRFIDKGKTLLEAGELSSLLDLAKGSEFKAAPLARLVQLGVETFQRNEARGSDMELVRRDLERQLEVLGAEARRGMGFLASTGSTAPFIGLFGTVIGIITAFTGIAASGGGGLDAVSAGIAEALIVTAVGLVVAIVAVLVFNFINGRLDKLDMSMQHAAGELLDHLEANRGRSA